MAKSKLTKNTVSISDISNAITNTTEQVTKPEPEAETVAEVLIEEPPVVAPEPINTHEESFGFTQFFTEDDAKEVFQDEQEPPVVEEPAPAVDNVPKPAIEAPKPSETPVEQAEPTPAKESAEAPENPAGAKTLFVPLFGEGDQETESDPETLSGGKPVLFVFEWACGKFSYHAGDLAFIGTKSADMLLPSKIDGFETGVSRRHALLEEEHGHVWLTDLGSTNGTYLNGDKLRRKESQMLRRGDDIRFGVLHVEVK